MINKNTFNENHPKKRMFSRYQYGKCKDRRKVMLPFTSPVSGEILWSGRGTAAAPLCFISPSLKKSAGITIPIAKTTA